MKPSKRTKRSILLSPLAFALSFGAYAETTVMTTSAIRPATPNAGQPFRAPTPGDDQSDDSEIAWIIDWLEKHGA